MDSPTQGRVGDMSESRVGGRLGKAAGAFRTISEVADELDVAQHVLRFWESKFPQVRPLKRGGGRRYYRPEDVDLLRRIRSLLYEEGYTIKGAQKLLKGQRRPLGDRGESSQPLTDSEEADLDFAEDELADDEPVFAPGRLDPDTRRSLTAIRDILVEMRASLTKVKR